MSDELNDIFDSLKSKPHEDLRSAIYQAMWNAQVGEDYQTQLYADILQLAKIGSKHPEGLEILLSEIPDTEE